MPVGVEKPQFPPKQPKVGGYKMLRKLRKSFVGHPGAILFLLISSAGVFQQPRLLTSTSALCLSFVSPQDGYDREPSDSIDAQSKR